MSARASITPTGDSGAAIRRYLKRCGASADAGSVMRTLWATMASRLRRQEGYSLVELIVVLAILGIVLGVLVASFTTGLNQQVDQMRREQAYANARLALQRMRVDVHCASGVTAVNQNAYGGFTLTLSVQNDTTAGWCPGVIPAGSPSTGVQWCTLPYPGSTTRWRLYRFLGENPTDCDGGAGSTFQVDYLAATPGIWPTNANVDTSDPLVWDATKGWKGNLWPTPAPCLPGQLETLAIDFNVAVDPVNYPNEHYELQDAIALRNAIRCT